MDLGKWIVAGLGYLGLGVLAVVKHGWLVIHVLTAWQIYHVKGLESAWFAFCFPILSTIFWCVGSCRTVGTVPFFVGNALGISVLVYVAALIAFGVLALLTKWDERRARE